MRERTSLLLPLIIVAVIVAISKTLLIEITHAIIGILLMIQLPLLILLIITISGWVIGNGRGSDFSVGGAFFFGLIVAALSVPIQLYVNSSAMLKASQAETVIAEDANLSFQERVPYEIAEAVSARSLGNVTGNATDYVQIAPGNNDYSTAVIRRGITKGYESVQSMNLPMYGSFNFANDIQFCDFSHVASHRLGGGWFNNQLDFRALNKISFFSNTTRIHEEDVTFACENETPMVYMPVTKMKAGFLHAYRVPAGMLIYNGETGQITYDAHYENENILTYPISVARAQRESLKTMTGFGDWVFNRSGYESTDKDEEDVNTVNPTEFSLHNQVEGNQLVTMLTPRGASVSVVALSTIPSHSTTAGLLNPLTVHKFETSRQAPSTIAADIIASKLDGYKANGLTVFEVIPSEEGNWTASIGKNQSIIYRAVIDPSGKATLYNSQGREISTLDPNDDNDNTEPSSPTIGMDFEDLTVDELQEIINRAVEELAHREPPVIENSELVNEEE